MNVPDRFNPPWTCPRPGHCFGERVCQELAGCTGERWCAAPTADRERTRAELDRLGIPHNLGAPDPVVTPSSGA